LFALGEYASAAQASAFEAIDRLARAQSPLLASIRSETTEVIPVSRITGRDGRELEIAPVPVQISLEIDIDPAIEGDLTGVLEALDAAAAQKERVLSKAVISSMLKITDLTGNKLEAGGRPLSWDLITDAFEKIDLSFDENGESNMSLILHPDAYARLAALGPPTKEQQARHDAVIANRRAEWESQRRARRLR
jgi:hypothetical protein